MRYPACEKLEIIRLVERSHLSTRKTLNKLGIPKSTFYRWYELYAQGGLEALNDQIAVTVTGLKWKDVSKPL